MTVRIQSSRRHAEIRPTRPQPEVRQASTLNHYSNHSRLVPPTTIQLDDERKARLSRLKVGGMTYDDVIAQLLSDVDEEAFRRRALEWVADLANRIRRKPGNRRIF